MSIVCLGEALVDLICPEPIDHPAAARSFEVRFGGALANVAVAARRTGAPAALAGGVGDDPWGRLLRDRLLAEGVEDGRLEVVPGMSTPYTFVTLDRAAEPAYRIHGDIEGGVRALGDRIGSVLGGATALVFGSNTLPGELAREVTLTLKREALGARLPVLFDPNLRPGRWHDLGFARTLCRAAIEGVTVVKANLAEARWLTGEDPELDPATAAERVRALGCELAVITDGPRTLFASGTASASADPPEIEVVSPIGAGDAFMGALAGTLDRLDWDLDRLGEALAAAAAAAAATCTHLGAID